MPRSREPGSVRSYARMSRVNALLRRVLAEEIERLADADERLSLLTVTEVICEPDLRHAVVYLASLPEEGGVALAERRKGLQAILGEQIRLRRVPMLSFAADPAVAAGARIEEALRRARRTAAAGAVEVATEADGRAE